jgi:hypothetical protein
MHELFGSLPAFSLIALRLFIAAAATSPRIRGGAG